MHDGAPESLADIGVARALLSDIVDEMGEAGVEAGVAAAVLGGVVGLMAHREAEIRAAAPRVVALVHEGEICIFLVIAGTPAAATRISLENAAGLARGLDFAMAEMASNTEQGVN